jgi:hypothetical protein
MTTSGRMKCDGCGIEEPLTFRDHFAVCYRPRTKDPVFFCSKRCLRKLVKTGVVELSDGPIFGGFAIWQQ